MRDDEVAHVAELAAFGPEPLSKKFTFEVFTSQLNKYPNRAIKPALMDPLTIAGIGNIYSDEILFRAKTRPLRRAPSLKPAELRALYKAIPAILKIGIQYKGASVGDFVRTDGSWGTMGKHHFVYGRGKQPCKVC